MKNIKSVLVIIAMICTIAMCAQPTFEVVPVAGDTTFQVVTTVKNTDNSESVTITEPYDYTGVQRFIDIQLNRNSRVTAKEVKKLKDLNSESNRLRSLFNSWNSATYFQATQAKYIDQFVGTWRLRDEGVGSLLTIDDKRKIDEFGGDRGGTLVIDSKDAIIVKNYMAVDTDIIFYREKEQIFVGEYNDKKIVLRKISNEIRE